MKNMKENVSNVTLHNRNKLKWMNNILYDFPCVIRAWGEGLGSLTSVHKPSPTNVSSQSIKRLSFYTHTHNRRSFNGHLYWPSSPNKYESLDPAEKMQKVAINTNSTHLFCDFRSVGLKLISLPFLLELLMKSAIYKVDILSHC